MYRVIMCCLQDDNVYVQGDIFFVVLYTGCNLFRVRVWLFFVYVHA